MRYAVFPASRRKQHASRVLHPGAAVGRQRDFDESALGIFATSNSESCAAAGAAHFSSQSRRWTITPVPSMRTMRTLVPFSTKSPPVIASTRFPAMRIVPLGRNGVIAVPN